MECNRFGYATFCYFALVVAFYHISKLTGIVSFFKRFALNVSLLNVNDLAVSFSNGFALSVLFFNVNELAVTFSLAFCSCIGCVIFKCYVLNLLGPLLMLCVLCHFSTLLNWACLLRYCMRRVFFKCYRNVCVLFLHSSTGCVNFQRF